MTDLNPVKTLRERLGMTQGDFGKMLPGDRGEGLSVSGVAKLEALPTAEQEESLLALAERAKSVEHVSYFKRLLGREDERGDSMVNLNELAPHERELAETVVDMYRHPSPGSVLQENISQILLEIRSVSGADTEMHGVLGKLSEEDRDVLARFLKRPESMKFIAGFAGGSRGEITGASVPMKNRSNKKGERMAK